MSGPRGVPVFLDEQTHSRLSADGQRLTVRDGHGSSHTLPVYRIAQVQVRTGRNSQLRGLAALAQRRRPVLLLDGRGQHIATIVAPHTNDQPLPWVNDMADLIASTSARDYDTWLEVQREHAASLILRRRRPGISSYERARVLLLRLIRRHIPPTVRARCVNELHSLVAAHAQEFTARHRLYPLVSALNDCGHDLIDDLRQLLLLPTLRAYYRRLRERPVPHAHRVPPFQADAREALDTRCTLHLRAMHDHMRRVEHKARNAKHPTWFSPELDALHPEDL